MSSGAYNAAQLRQELCARNRVFAAQHALAHVESYGGMPVIVFEPTLDGKRHGNFLDASYAAILERPEWRRRLAKVHAQAKQALPTCDRGWKELDSSMSSDALLMNIFCYPGVVESIAVRSLLGVDTLEIPQFGFKPRVPLKSGLADRTEVDLRLGDLLVEAKLTESDFQTKDATAVLAYRDIEEVFDVKILPRVTKTPGNGTAGRQPKQFASYQLLRNVLAAHASGCSFCVLLDARRPDLLDAWYDVMRCIVLSQLRLRCKALTWQELSEALPLPLQQFLDHKYGIVPPGRVAAPVGATFESTLD
jgi:hypothetical protein